jgi:hypothetical protein
VTIFLCLVLVGGLVALIDSDSRRDNECQSAVEAANLQRNYPLDIDAMCNMPDWREKLESYARTSGHG